VIVWQLFDFYISQACFPALWTCGLFLFLHVHLDYRGTKHDMAHLQHMPPQYMVQHTQRGAGKEALFQIKKGEEKMKELRPVTGGGPAICTIQRLDKIKRTELGCRHLDQHRIRNFTAAMMGQEAAG
jgi:hypothetical protein